MKNGEKKLTTDDQTAKESVSAEPPKLSVSPTPPNTQDIDRLRQLAQDPKSSSSSSILLTEKQTFSQKYQKEAQKIRKLRLENDGTEKDQGHKGMTLILLFILLYAETTTIFVLTFLQGFKWHKFNLDQWTLRLVVSSTLAEIAGMLLIAVKHLFPDRKAERKG